MTDTALQQLVLEIAEENRKLRLEIEELKSANNALKTQFRLLYRKLSKCESRILLDKREIFEEIFRQN